MTLTVGFLRHGGAYLITDSAVTHDGPAWTLKSSMGELVTKDSRTVEEAATKIVQLSSHAGAAITGDAGVAEVLLASFRPHVGAGNLVDVIDQCAAGQAGSENCELVIARHLNAQPQLFHYKSKKTREIPAFEAMVGPRECR